MRRVVIWILILASAAVLLWWTQIRPKAMPVSVYFVGQADGGATLVVVQRTADGRSAEALLRAAFEALLAGPSADEQRKGLVTEIPAGTRLRGLSVREGVAIVDLTEAFASGGGSTSMQARLWQVVYTGTQLPQARQVRVLIEGAERQALGGEGLLIDRPIGRPAAFPRF